MQVLVNENFECYEYLTANCLVIIKYGWFECFFYSILAIWGIICNDLEMKRGEDTLQKQGDLCKFYMHSPTIVH